jgi:hypothetical protein
VRERQGGGVVDVVAARGGVAAVCGKGSRGVVDDHVGAVAEHLGFDADRGDEACLGGGDADPFDSGHRFAQGSGEVLVSGSELVGELVAALLEGRVTLRDQHALVRVADAFDIDAEPEAVQQLGAQLALLGVHRADEDEARGVGKGNAFALDDVDTHRGSVEEDVDEVVVEEVDLVDVEDVAVRLREDAWLEALGAGAQGGFDVDSADHAVLGRVDGELDDAHAALVRGQGAVRRHARAALDAEALAVLGVAAIVAALDDGVLGEEAGQGAHGGGFAGALFTTDEDPADGGDYGVEDQGKLHRLLPHDRGKGKDVTIELEAHEIRIGARGR